MVANTEKINDFIVNISFDVKESKKSIFNQNTDSMVLLLDKNDKLISEEYMAFYNNKATPDKSILFENKKTDPKFLETIHLSLDNVDKNVKKILFIISIYKAKENRLHFGQVTNLSITFTNKLTKEIFATYKPETQFNNSCFISLVSFVFDKEWDLEVVGEGYEQDFYEFLNNFIKDANEEIKVKNNEELESKYYKALESTKESTNEQLKAKYRDLSKAFHPDFIQPLVESGKLHKDFLVFAQERFMEIKKSYEYLKKLRKM